MGTYGRNFEFRIPPRSEDRKGRFITPDTGTLVIGAPVMADTSEGFDSAMGLQVVRLADAAEAPKKGMCGIALYEHAPAAFAGFDESTTTYSDFGTMPASKALQVVSGTYVKVVFTNTPASRSFYGQHTYVGRTMVNGLGATATVVEGDYLVPGAGNDTAGYWASTASATNAWMVITKVDTTRAEVEAQMLF